MSIQFTIPGPPQGKGRPRFSRSGPHVRTYTPANTASYENLVKLEYQRQCGSRRFEAGIPLDMRITAYYPIPKSVSRKKHQAMADRKILPTKKPDASNVIKAIEDGLNCIAYQDDSQIAFLSIRRFYSEEPRVLVYIKEAN